MKVIILFLSVCFLFGCSHDSSISPTSQLLVGDINKDGVVDQADIDLVGAAFGSRQGDPSWNQDADIDGNGEIDGYDLILVSVNKTQ